MLEGIEPSSGRWGGMEEVAKLIAVLHYLRNKFAVKTYEQGYNICTTLTLLEDRVYGSRVTDVTAGECDISPPWYICIGCNASTTI